MIDQTYYDEQTTFKVHEALKRSGLDRFQIQAAIISMLNAGILFRERVPQDDD